MILSSLIWTQENENETLLINRAEGFSLEGETALVAAPVEFSCSFSCLGERSTPFIRYWGFGKQLLLNYISDLPRGLALGLP